MQIIMCNWKCQKLNFSSKQIAAQDFTLQHFYYQLIKDKKQKPRHFFLPIEPFFESHVISKFVFLKCILTINPPKKNGSKPKKTRNKYR